MPIRRHDVHVCLVSEQATPNFIPVLDTRFRPHEVVLIVTPQMRERASWLKQAIERRRVIVTEPVVDDAWDVWRISPRKHCWICSPRAGELILRSTCPGGTKAMLAIAAQEVLRSAKLPIFYDAPGS